MVEFDKNRVYSYQGVRVSKNEAKMKQKQRKNRTENDKNAQFLRSCFLPGFVEWLLSTGQKSGCTSACFWPIALV